MHRFWSKLKHKHNSTANHDLSDQQLYSVNDTECSRENCGPLIKRLLETDEQFKIKKQRKIIDIERFANQKNTDSANIYLEFPLAKSLIQKVIASGQENYQKLIELFLNAVDSGLSAEQDFGNHYQQFEFDIKDAYHFALSYQIEQDTPFFSEIQEMMSEYTRLIWMNLIFAISKISSSNEGDGYMKRYGNECVPQIIFPQIPQETKIVDFASANAFIKHVLNNIYLAEEHIKKKDCYVPPTKSFALGTLKQIEEMAKKYSKIFDEHLEMTTEGSLMAYS